MTSAFGLQNVFRIVIGSYLEFWNHKSMGWMRTLLLGDIGNRLDIEDTEKDIAEIREAHSRASSSMAGKRAQIAALKAELGRHKLAIEALTRFLVAKEIIDGGELEEFIAAVDLEDGVADGKLSLDHSTRKLRLIIPGATDEDPKERV